MSSSAVPSVSAAISGLASSPSDYAAARAANAVDAASKPNYTLPEDKTSALTTTAAAATTSLKISPLPSTTVTLSTTSSVRFGSIPLTMAGAQYANSIARQNQLNGDIAAANLADPAILIGPDSKFVADYTSAPLTPVMSAGEFQLGRYAEQQLNGELNRPTDLENSFFTFDSYSQQISNSTSSTSNANQESMASAGAHRVSSSAGGTQTRTVKIEGSGHIFLSDGETIAFTAELGVSGSLTAFAPEVSSDDGTQHGATSSDTGAGSVGGSANPATAASTGAAVASGTGNAAFLSPSQALTQSNLTAALDHAKEILLMIDSIKAGAPMAADLQAKTDELSQVRSLNQSTAIFRVTVAPTAIDAAGQKAIAAGAAQTLASLPSPTQDRASNPTATLANPRLAT